MERFSDKLLHSERLTKNVRQKRVTCNARALVEQKKSHFSFVTRILKNSTSGPRRTGPAQYTKISSDTRCGPDQGGTIFSKHNLFLSSLLCVHQNKTYYMDNSNGKIYTPLKMLIVYTRLIGFTISLFPIKICYPNQLGSPCINYQLFGLVLSIK